MRMWGVQARRKPHPGGGGSARTESRRGCASPDGCPQNLFARLWATCAQTRQVIERAVFLRGVRSACRIRRQAFAATQIVFSIWRARGYPQNLFVRLWATCAQTVQAIEQAAFLRRVRSAGTFRCSLRSSQLILIGADDRSGECSPEGLSTESVRKAVGNLRIAEPGY